MSAKEVTKFDDTIYAALLDRSNIFKGCIYGYVLSNWKALLMEIAPKAKFFVNFPQRPQSRVYLNIQQVKEDFDEPLISQWNAILQHDLPTSIYLFDETSMDLRCISVSTFMVLTVESKSAPQTTSTRLIGGSAKLEDAFKHSLSTSGKNALDYVKASIVERFSKWNDGNTNVVVPLASLSQGSGSGKSKLSVEMVQDGPGFYIVTRQVEDEKKPKALHGYPKNNKFSEVLKDLVSKSDDIAMDYTNNPYYSCRTGRILFFFSQIITSYLRDLHLTIKNLMDENLFGSDERLVHAACSSLGKLFEQNDAIDCDSVLNNSRISQHILNEASSTKIVSVNSIAKYIQIILDDPFSALDDQLKAIIPRRVSTAISKCLALFPFIFVLDKADELTNFAGWISNDDSSNFRVTGFEVLRRAISYLLPCTKIFFLTLGTRSDILDLNPPLREINSGRLKERNVSLRPIILISNTSIFSKEEFPIKDVKVDYEVLQNPVFFKYLVTLGHPLWSSLVFNSVVGVASAKIVNDSSESYNFVPVLWMIRAGFAANPLSLSTRRLIASHMATLFDLSPDLANMIVFYPSDPILALGCRSLINSLCKIPSAEEHLFSKLEELFEGVQIDRGQVAECIGTMTVLRAIDLAAYTGEECRAESLEALVQKMTLKYGEDHKLSRLWKKKSFVLEPENTDEITYDFGDYHVTSVEEFLVSLLGAAKFEKIKSKLPAITLNGLVNASHAVKITRNGENLVFNNESFEAIRIPLSDERISDRNCNLIDVALLRLALIHQCCFLMPDRYYGYDLIVPVMLEDGTFTFIGIQFKAADTSFALPVEKMQARFHYSKTGSENEQLATIFGNQITVLMCLEPNEEYSFATVTKSSIPKPNHRSNSNLAICDEEYDSCISSLNQALQSSNPRQINLSHKGTSFKKPLLMKCEPFDDPVPAMYLSNLDDSFDDEINRLMLISAIWNDSLIELPGNQLKIGETRVIPFVPDGYWHRQYCIATRGLDLFKHLFAPINSIPNAKKLIAGDSQLYKRFKQVSDQSEKLRLLKSMFYDASLNYLDYNSVLAKWRGLEHPDIDSISRRYFEIIVQAITSTNFGGKRIDWIFGNDLPSKNPPMYASLTSALRSKQYFKLISEFEELNINIPSTRRSPRLVSQKKRKYQS